MRDPQAPTPRADRIFVALAILMHAIWMLLMGVDVMRLRYSPSMPVAIHMLGMGLLLAGKYHGRESTWPIVGMAAPNPCQA